LTEYVSIARLPAGDDPGTFDAGRDLFEETYQLASQTGIRIIVLSAIIACVGVAVPWHRSGVDLKTEICRYSVLESNWLWETTLWRPMG